jgi:hypothetical protein
MPCPLDIRAATIADAGTLARWDTYPHVREAVHDDGLTGFDCEWVEELQPRQDGAASFIAEVKEEAIGAM